jgi:hypothetical protein
MNQARHILRFGLLDELDGRWKVNAQVLRPVIGDRYLEVFDLACLLENIRQRRHVQDVANVVFLDFRDILAVGCVAEEQARKNLDGLTAVRFQGIVGSTFAIRRFR